MDSRYKHRVPYEIKDMQAKAVLSVHNSFEKLSSSCKCFCPHHKSNHRTDPICRSLFMLLTRVPTKRLFKNQNELTSRQKKSRGNPEIKKHQYVLLFVLLHQAQKQTLQFQRKMLSKYCDNLQQKIGVYFMYARVTSQLQSSQSTRMYMVKRQRG